MQSVFATSGRHSIVTVTEPCHDVIHYTDATVNHVAIVYSPDEDPASCMVETYIVPNLSFVYHVNTRKFKFHFNTK